MAGGLPGKIISKALPLGAAAAGDVADIVLNDTSAGNKIMDTAAMGIGGTIGGVLGLGNPFAIAVVQVLAKWQVTLPSLYLEEVSLPKSVN